MASTAPRALVVLRLPIELKRQLNALRRRGVTINGFITHLIERELNDQRPPHPAGPSGRKR